MLLRVLSFESLIAQILKDWYLLVIPFETVEKLHHKESCCFMAFGQE